MNPQLPPEEHSPEDIDHQYSNSILRIKRLIWSIMVIQSVVLLCLLGAVIFLLVQNGDNNAHVTQQVEQNQSLSDHRWCATMDLLTQVPVQKPADPTANPSREASYQLYVDFVALKASFGCDQLSP